jgi:hypothetical protein
MIPFRAACGTTFCNANNQNINGMEMLAFLVAPKKTLPAFSQLNFDCV